MIDALYITNRTDKPMHAVILDNNTGSNVLTCELHPGANKITVESLDSGTYLIRLSDDKNDVFYTQKIVKD